MRTNDRLSFLLIAEQGDARREYVVHPSYSGLKVSHTKNRDRAYYESGLDAQFTFMGGEFELLMSYGLRAKFTLAVKDLGREVSRGCFRKTDLDVDCNHKTAKVKITAADIYDQLEGSNSEWNIVKWGLEKHEIAYNINPTIQMYVLDDTKLHYFTAGGHHDVDYSGDSPSYDDISGARLNFAKMVYGAFHADKRDGVDVNIWFYRAGAVFTDDISFWSFVSDGIGSIFITRESRGKYKVTAALYPDSYVSQEITMRDLMDSTSLRLEGSGDTQGALLVSCRFWTVCMRVLTNAATTHPIQSDDPFTQDYLFSSQKVPTSYPSVRTSMTDKGYGSVEINNVIYYYDTPDDTHTYVPLKRESWGKGMSFWARTDYYNPRDMIPYVVGASIRDFYDLGDVIRHMLSLIDDSLIFEKNAAHSRFLFSAFNPLSGVRQGRLYITQKSNFLNLSYDYPAWSALLTFNRLRTFLRNALNCFYDIYVDDFGNKHFRIEHLYFYENGMSYTDVERKLIDLNKIRDVRTQLTYAYNTNRWKYDTEHAVDRKEFSWMDTQSEAFDGFPMEVPKEYSIYTRHNIEDCAIDWFSADIDFLRAKASECRSDGFLVVMTDGEDNGRVCSGSVVINGTAYEAQNYMLSMVYLQQRFHIVGFYSQYVVMNGTDILVPVPERFRKPMRLQEVSFQLPKNLELESGSMFVTEVGEGTADKVEIDYTSNHVTLTIRQKTETI